MMPRARVWVFAIAVMVLTLLPYALGWSVQTESARYSGFLVGADDGFSYMGKMRLGVEGHWDFFLFYTDDPHPAVPLTFLPYILPGQLLRLFITPDSPHVYTAMIVTFHLMRVVFGVLLILITERFLAAFIPNADARFVALVIATLGGGFGWLLITVGIVPPEWLIPEAFTFLVLYLLPHVALARAALLLGMLALMQSQRDWRYALLAGALWWITGLGVPFYLAVIYAVLGVWGALVWLRGRVFPWALFWRTLIAAGLTLPLFAFYYRAFAVNVTFAQWSAQNILITPPVWQMLLSYAPFLVLGAWGVRVLWRNDEPFSLLPIAWALVGLLLIYAPLNVQRRLGEGVLVALAVLTVVGLQALSKQDAIGRWWRGLAYGLTLPAMLLFFIMTGLAVVTQPPELFTSADEIAVFDYLTTNMPESERGAVILAPLRISTRAPAYAPVRTFIGHGPETPNAAEKEPLALAYFADELDAATREELYARPLDYVIFDSPPPTWVNDELNAVFTSGALSVWQVPMD